jgi:hypothetical protein
VFLRHWVIKSLLPISFAAFILDGGPIDHTADVSKRLVCLVECVLSTPVRPFVVFLKVVQCRDAEGFSETFGGAPNITFKPTATTGVELLPSTSHLRAIAYV